jgi:hypothetical protein
MQKIYILFFIILNSFVFYSCESITAEDIRQEASLILQNSEWQLHHRQIDSLGGFIDTNSVITTFAFWNDNEGQKRIDFINSNTYTTKNFTYTVDYYNQLVLSYNAPNYDFSVFTLISLDEEEMVLFEQSSNSTGDVGHRYLYKRID